MGHSSKRFFIGLPIPIAACAVAAMVLLIPDVESPSLTAFSVLIVMYFISFLMVSKFRYRSFKDVEWRRRRPIGTLFFYLIVMIVLLHEPATVLFLTAFVYLLSGIITHFLPEATLEFFRKLDNFLLDVKVLDDSETDELATNSESSKVEPELKTSEDESEEGEETGG